MNIDADIMKKDLLANMNRQENVFDKAWICVGAPLNIINTAYRMWKKFSCIDFQIFYHRGDEALTGTIGSFGIFPGDDGRNLDIIQVLDPHTFEVVVKDVWDLQCKTPFELFMKLDLQGLLVY